MIHNLEGKQKHLWMLQWCFGSFLKNITVSCGSLENSEIYHMLRTVVFKNLASALLFLAQSPQRVQKPQGATEALSCLFLLLPSFEHQHSHGQAENKDQFSVCPQRVACAYTREMAASPASATSSPEQKHLQQCQSQQQHTFYHILGTSTWKFRDWFSRAFIYTHSH